jgi:hypothetical protein
MGQGQRAYSQISSSSGPGKRSTNSAPLPRANTLSMSTKWLNCSPNARRTQGQL